MAEDEPGFFDLLQNLFTQNIEQLPDVSRMNKSAAAVRNTMTERVKDQMRQRRADYQLVRTKMDPKVEKIRRKALKQFDKMEKALSQAVEANHTKKIWYTLSIINILAIGMIVAAHPELMHKVYTCELLFLLPLRFWTYRQRNWHYFLADLCYYVNGLLICYVWIWPQWSALWVSCFAFSYGSLAASVILWRNSLVLQSIDKTTSSFIHLMPPLVTYCINFRLDPATKTQRFPGAFYTDTWNTVNSVFITTLAYFVWQLAYHYFITVRRADKIKQGTVTSFEFMRRRYAKSWMGRFVNGLPGPLPVIAFTLIQFAFQMVTMVPCPLYYMHEWLTVSVLIIIFSVASFNGASYYIDVYGERFHTQLKELQAEFDKLEEQRDDDSGKDIVTESNETD